MRAFALPRVARAAWLVFLLAPAVALAAPKGRPKKPPKKAPVTKPSKPVDEAPAPDTEGEAAKDPRTSGASGTGDSTGTGASAGGTSTGGTSGGSAIKKVDPGAPAEDRDRDKDRDKDKDRDRDKKAELTADKAEPAEKTDGEPDVDALRQEYLSLRDELFRSRARANAVASQLYSTRMQIRLTYTSGRYYSPVKSQIRLDGAVVYEDTKSSIAEDDGIRFDGYVAPGRHLITFRVEAVGKDDDTFASVSESQITVKAIADKDLIVAAKAKDGGDIAYEWKKKEKGSYGLAIDVAVKTQPRTEGQAKGSASGSGSGGGGGATAPAKRSAK